MKYSYPLTKDSRTALTDFLVAYLDSLRSPDVDITAAVAKDMAIKALSTDLDILVFMVTAGLLYSNAGGALMACAVRGVVPIRETAEKIVAMVAQAIQIDKSTRPI
jgi:hypothetical protein